MDINTDSDGDRAKDPDMAIGCSSGLDVTMALGGSAWHLDLCGPGSSMALRYQHGLRSWPGP